jgi:hypothetical protein
MGKKHRQQNPASPGNEPESATETAWAMAATRETVISHLYSLPLTHRRSSTDSLKSCAQSLSINGKFYSFAKKDNPTTSLLTATEVELRQ